MKVDCSIYYGDGYDWNGEYFESVRSAKSEMQRLKKLGHDDVRMYADYDNGNRLVYYFNKDGKIVKESNNLCN